MDPEFVTSRHSAHARVECVACHVGSGATAYVKTKISGMRQLYHVVRNDFERPIRLNRRSSDRLGKRASNVIGRRNSRADSNATFRHYLADEKNTPFSVRLLINVGGGNPLRGPVGGIHWHMNIANKIEYITTDDQQRVIPWVRHTDSKGVVTIYQNPDFKGDLSKYPIHTMDCLDCHNRPSHNFLSPNEAVDISLAAGRIDPKIPWVKIKSGRSAGAAIRHQAGSAEEDRNSDTGRLSQSPRRKRGHHRNAVDLRGQFLSRDESGLRSYPDHISHKEWDGCFRCHDGKHKTTDGKTSIAAKTARPATSSWPRKR